MLSPLFSVYREEFEELRVFGNISVDTGDARLHSREFAKYPARSTLKPFQFLATGNAIPTKAGEGESLETLRAQRAAAVGSPSATLDQIEQLIDWFGGENWEKRVKCSAQWPLDDDARCMLKDRGDPSPIFGMCFSKHMNILEACRREGWNESGYLGINHPYHARLSALVGEALGETSKFRRSWVTDGCGLPTPALTLGELARLYRWLATSKRTRPLCQLFFDFPDWIGGPGRSDTVILSKNPGKIIAKEGADGLLCLGIPANSRFPAGAGVAIKICGFDHKLLLAAAYPVLKHVGLKAELPVFPGQRVEFHFKPFEKRGASEWLDISPLTDEGSAVFPGDTPYRRKLSFDTKKGHHLTLSSIQTTVHVGAHADAPNHFSTDKRGIDSVAVDAYLGPCQVIHIKKHGVLTAKDLTSVRIGAPRVLFRTDSFPNSKRWSDDFATLSPALIEYLGKSGVRLVGIDTPSIDPSHSKKLPGHRATLKFEMRILEGLDLRRIDEGLYELSAAPLRLSGADASPVRALLKK